MYNVSLLPKEYRMIHTNARKKGISLLVELGVMGVLFAAYLILTVVHSGKLAELNGIKAENQAVNMQIAKLGDIKTVSDEVEAMLSDVNKAIGATPNWEQIIVQIGNSVPPTISMESMNIEYRSKKGICTIVGTAIDKNTVTGWLLSIQEIKEIGEVKINYLSQASDMENSVTRFEIDLSIKEGTEYTFSSEGISNE